MISSCMILERRSTELTRYYHGAFVAANQSCAGFQSEVRLMLLPRLLIVVADSKTLVECR